MNVNCVVFNVEKLELPKNLYPARWWHALENNEVECFLCPRHCRLKNGKRGVCRVRTNIEGSLFSEVYGKPIAIHVDPIEKKPLYHFQPGSRIFSIGTAGCNLQCEFCQNWDISTADGHLGMGRIVQPAEIVQSAIDNQCGSIAFTYNEPTIFGEYVVDIAKIAHQSNLKTVKVTNGYITQEAIADIYPLIDAANIDLKSMNADFYRKRCHAELTPVLEAIVAIQKVGTFIELTTLLIPGLNDSEGEIQKLCDWILDNLGNDTPLHFSAFHPAYKMSNWPQTTKEVLDRARTIALRTGLHYVYEGNVLTDSESDTFCPACGRVLIKRGWYTQVKKSLQGNRCECWQKIPIIW